MLRRLKQDVEQQLPKKYEHVLLCELSRRQRLLYDEFMSRFIGVMFIFLFFRHLAHSSTPLSFPTL